MASTPAIAAGYLSDEAEREEAEMQTAFEQLVSWIKELVGATGDGAKVNIASGVIPIVSNISTYMVDSEGGSGADDLGYISGTARDGQLVALRLFNAARPISILNGAGGAGQILTKNGQTLVLSSLKQFAIFKYVASGDYYEEWLRDETARIDQLLGAQPVSSVSVTSSQITVDRGRHTVTSGTTTNIDQALGIDSFDHNGNLLILSLADTSYVRTLRHNQGTTGKFNLLGAANIVMVANAFYCFSKNGTTWDHLFTIAPVTSVGASANAQSLLFGDGSGGWASNDFSAVTAGYKLVKKATAPYFEFIADSAAGSIVNDFRVSLSSTNPDPSTDVTGASTIYGLPFKGNAISVYSGSGSVWNTLTAASISIAVPSTQYFRIYNVYVYDNASVATFELDAWDSGGQTTKTITAATAANPCVITTSSAHGLSVGDLIGIRKGTGTGTGWTDTAMGLDQKVFRVSAVPLTTTIELEGCDASALTFSSYTGATLYKIPTSPTTAPIRQNGVWCKTGTLTRRFLGTFMTNGAGTVDDSTSARLLSNVDNRTRAVLSSEDTTASYTTAVTSTFYPRSNSIALGKTRVHMINALAKPVPLHVIDGPYVGSFALSRNNCTPCTLSNWASSFLGAFTVGYYSYTGAFDVNPSVPAGFSFFQHFNYGNGNPFYSSAYASSATMCRITAEIER